MHGGGGPGEKWSGGDGARHKQGVRAWNTRGGEERRSGRLVGVCHREAGGWRIEWTREVKGVVVDGCCGKNGERRRSGRGGV